MTIQSSCDDIRVLAEAGICTITFNRVAKKNSLTGAMYLALAEILQQAASSTEVRVVLFQGDASVFTAGNDLGDFLHGPQPDDNAPPFQFLQALAAFPKPIVAAVCGPAVGIGTTMLLHCDLVYAGDNAMFSLPFVNLGFCPEGASSLLLPQLMGHQRASEALLLGDPFMAEAALEVGLVNRVVPPTECNTIAQAQAAKLAAKPLASLMASKRLLKSGQMAAVQSRIAEEGRVFADLLQQPAAKEAMQAFMEKRKPNFSGL
ncbi:enoyl-CoA hydratase/carnithine racemase [Comamonas sp. BIGb0152]|uniref:enoyl-CoA hydratase n=1 Tax=Comamonas sp. BIGb0152 TaxID=2940601 RepID=UPI00216AA436|nr:enoyl-CoA hydratase [Comamonas sp. BIGb0152]MCS4294688.1 enoyl-CoA hydratase/carnithine racemase [Comamonas sp. BIGb0152]